MFKRVTIVALVVAAFLVLAVPAMAFNGYRGDYTTSAACQTCHDGTAGIPAVWSDWAETKHGTSDAGWNPDDVTRLPYASVCQGCHTSNFDPAKLTPVPTATSAKGAVSWAASPAPTVEPTAFPMGTQTTGNLAWSEASIGCSSCHYGANVTGGLAVFGVDTNDSAHRVPLGNMADAQICGACHSRYSYTTQTYTVAPVPYTTVTLPLPGTPVVPNPSPTTLIQPQFAIGYPMLGSPSSTPAWSPNLSAYLNIPAPGWNPTPNPAATKAGFGRLSTFWKVDGVEQKWQQVTHEGSSGQYPEWANEGHANALTGLTSQSFWGFLPEATKQQCLECHSADYRLLKEAGQNPTSAQVKYGITCVGCHAPHDAGTVKGVWDEALMAQLNNDASLRGNGSNLCVECHNGEIPAGTTASPGAEIHHPMKEMMDGYGAIDVAAFPSVHKGKCIQCHMPPTYWQRGAVQRGANHTFEIIQPKDAVEASPVPVVTAEATAIADGVTTVTKTVTWDSMPYSACSTCHNQNTNPSPKPTATATAGAGTSNVTITIDRIADGAQIYSRNTNTWSPGGDKALWLQDTIDQRREWTQAKIAEIHNELNAGAVRLGYADEAAAHEALVAITEADRTFGQTNFLKAFTNVGFVESEGSFGLHNWDYSREIVNVALLQARAVQAGQAEPRKWIVSLRVSKTKINKGQKIFFRGVVQTGWGLAGNGKVTLQRRMNGQSWRNWKTTTLMTNGTYSVTQRLNFARGKWFFRARMPGDGGLNLTAVSPNRVIRIR